MSPAGQRCCCDIQAPTALRLGPQSLSAQSMLAAAPSPHPAASACDQVPAILLAAGESGQQQGGCSV
eukprot:95198-Chlamydomonas_euryale.AAC.11